MEHICLNAGNLGSTPSQRENNLLFEDERGKERGGRAVVKVVDVHSGLVCLHAGTDR